MKARFIFLIMALAWNEWCFYPFPAFEISRRPECKLLMFDLSWLVFKIRLSITKNTTIKRV